VKGIILAGGSGTRLHPVTLGVVKQLLPVYDKPMVYYPMSVLMLAGVRDVLIISTPIDLAAFERLFGDGSDLGMSITYRAQENPTGGIAQAFVIGEDHIGGDTCCLVLGDNMFHGHGLQELLGKAAALDEGCVLFGYRVTDPERYGVAEVENGRVVSIEEKPEAPRSNLAVTGLYFYDADVVPVAKAQKPSPRGQLEITDVNNAYIERGTAQLFELGRGTAWLDMGTHDSLVEAATFVQVLEHRQGEAIACLEEVAWRMDFIGREQLGRLGDRLGKSNYGQYVRRLAAEGTPSTP
jgi:glucose-1-phosphate thymidylyltransferase